MRLADISDQVLQLAGKQRCHEDLCASPLFLPDSPGSQAMLILPLFPGKSVLTGLSENAREAGFSFCFSFSLKK